MLGGKYELSPQASIYAGLEHAIRPSLRFEQLEHSNHVVLRHAPRRLVTAKAFGSSWGDAPIRVIWAGGDYDFTEAFGVSVAITTSTMAATATTTSTPTSIFDHADYRFNKRFDVYAG